jgi:cysteine-rich repeat protein
MIPDSVSFNHHNCSLMLVLGLLPLLACVGPESERCPSGRYCPEGFRCAAYQDECIWTNCGDGIVQDTEMCDDGNIADGDGCKADCSSDERCGNGLKDVHIGEVCDDGNTSSGDGCSADCRSGEGCGNGIVDRNKEEVCDDGNIIDGDDCTNQCLPAACGDGIQKTTQPRAEDCDPGSDGQTASCDCDCTRPVCGDRIVNPLAGEQCDPGKAGLDSQQCNRDCTISLCGDGYHNGQAGEICDDGNTDECGRCNAMCSEVQVFKKATGKIIAAAASVVGDAELFIVNDGLQSVVFEFDKNGDHTSTHVRINIKDLWASGVAVAIARAINAHESLQVVAEVDEEVPRVVNLRHERAGVYGNHDIVETVSTSDFRVQGLSGGRGYFCPEGTGCAMDADCAPELECKPETPELPARQGRCVPRSPLSDG